MELMLLLGAALALGNIVASVAVLRVSVLSPSQRVLQLTLIWLVPVIGAIVCAAFASSQALASTSSGTIAPSTHYPMVAHRTAKTLGSLAVMVETLATPGAVTSGLA